MTATANRSDRFTLSDYVRDVHQFSSHTHRAVIASALRWAHERGEHAAFLAADPLGLTTSNECAGCKESARVARTNARAVAVP